MRKFAFLVRNNFAIIIHARPAPPVVLLQCTERPDRHTVIHSLPVAAERTCVQTVPGLATFALAIACLLDFAL